MSNHFPTIDALKRNPISRIGFPLARGRARGCTRALQHVVYTVCRLLSLSLSLSLSFLSSSHSWNINSNTLLIKSSANTVSANRSREKRSFSSASPAWKDWENNLEIREIGNSLLLELVRRISRVDVCEKMAEI